MFRIMDELGDMERRSISRGNAMARIGGVGQSYPALPPSTVSSLRHCPFGPSLVLSSHTERYQPRLSPA